MRVQIYLLMLATFVSFGAFASSDVGVSGTSELSSYEARYVFAKDSFTVALESYVKAYTRYEQGDEDAIDEVKYNHGRKIVHSLFDQYHEKFYLNALKAIDQQSKKFPMAMAELAYSLQAEWEKRYLQSYIQIARQNREVRHRNEQIILNTAALLLPGYGITKAVLHVPHYFTAFRLGVGAFAVLNTAAVAQAVMTKTPPRAPAEMMALGMPLQEKIRNDFEDEKFYRDVNARLMGITTSAVTAVWVGRALTTTGKVALGGSAAVSPETLGLSLLAGLAVDYTTTEIAEATLNYLTKQEIIGELSEATLKFEEALEAKASQRRLMTLARNLVGAALKYEIYYGYDLLKEIVEGRISKSNSTQEDLEESAEDLADVFVQSRHGIRSSVHNQNMLTWFDEVELNPRNKDDYAHLKQAIRGFQPASQKTASALMAGYLSSSSKSGVDFADYREKYREKERRRLRNKIVLNARTYNFGENVPETLLSVASLIQSSDSPVVSYFADQILLDRVNKYTLINIVLEGQGK